MPKVARLLIYPVKSLDGQEVTEARILASGAIAHDRAYALVDSAGGIVNAKRHAAIHRLRSRVDIDNGAIALRDESDRRLGAETFDLRGERGRLHDWLSAFFGFTVFLQEDRDTGFPDDPESPGPTILSTATLAEIASWFALELNEVRARFRANIEIDGVPPFREDRLFGPSGSTVPFSIGVQRFLGINPCLRCIVPTRDSRTGRLDPGFSRRFAEWRRATLPDWVVRERLPPFYRAAINTRIGPGALNSKVAIGDEVMIGEAPRSCVAAAHDDGAAPALPSATPRV